MKLGSVQVRRECPLKHRGHNDRMTAPGTLPNDAQAC